ncbi:MAG TPA: hypothetical protein VHN80_31185 [Kineosporiaceae bacterium]|nr:hypothetical protein [Kineosporiaceae bacterium]
MTTSPAGSTPGTYVDIGSAASGSAARVVRALASRGRPGTTVLIVCAALSLLGLLVAGAGLLLDHRSITGAPAWLKPAKFSGSIAVYSVTLAWLLSLVDGHRAVVRTIGWVTAFCVAAELVLIDLQAARGTTSHFNDATAFDRAVFGAMGTMIGVVFVACVVTAVLLLRQRLVDPVLGSGIRAGLLVCAAGMAEAGLMIANRSISPGGAHTVGAPDGGPGLPILGWSTQYGDLRVAHFVGLHALQVLPLIAWLVRRQAWRWSARAQVGLVRIAGAAMFGLVVLLAWQAERAQPLLNPAGAVVVGGCALVLATAVAVAVTLRRTATTGPTA